MLSRWTLLWRVHGGDPGRRDAIEDANREFGPFTHRPENTRRVKYHQIIFTIACHCYRFRIPTSVSSLVSRQENNVFHINREHKLSIKTIFNASCPGIIVECNTVFYFRVYLSCAITDIVVRSCMLLFFVDIIVSFYIQTQVEPWNITASLIVLLCTVMQYKQLVLPFQPLQVFIFQAKKTFMCQ